MKYLYRPNHPEANENGMVSDDLVQDYHPWTVGIISDAMEPIRHMATGRILDSKSKFRADTRASGCVEIGNEPIKPRQAIPLDRRKRREDIQRAVYHLRRQSR